MLTASPACIGAEKTWPEKTWPEKTWPEKTWPEKLWTVQTSSKFLRATVPVQLMVTRRLPAPSDPPQPAMAPYRCRVIPAHADIGLKMLAHNGCVVELSIVRGRTRLSRFELDPVMSVDIVVYKGNQRVSFLSTRLTYSPP